MWLWLWDSGIVLDSQQNCGRLPAPGDISEQSDTNNKTEATGDDSSILPGSEQLSDIFKNIFMSFQEVELIQTQQGCYRRGGCRK